MMKKFALVLVSVVVSLYIFYKCSYTSGNENFDGDIANSIENALEENIFHGFNLNEFHIEQGKVEAGWTLSHMFAPFNVSQQAINQLAKNAKDELDFKYITEGKSYTMLCTKDSSKNALYCIYDKNPYELIVFNLADSTYAYTIEKEVTVKEKSIKGIIKEGSSLYLSVQNELSSNAVAAQLVDEIASTYAWTIDFFKLYPEDEYKVIFEEKSVEGEVVGVGKIKAVYFKHRSADFYGFAYKQNDKLAFFDEKGQGLKKAFLKAPLKFSRLSSPYSSNRFHPVQKRWKAHLGTDYAAPTGTPILATADGVVEAATRNSANGNYVKLKHNSTYQTGYLHMSKIANGMKPGARVKQGDVIGYVGSTGLATGPHVCYRFWKNGKQIDHRQEKFQTSEPIKKENMDAYLKHISPIKNALDKIK
jgi:murein DD-endopeptidase MepM/ murein hydrolase activator NlpD